MQNPAQGFVRQRMKVSGLTTGSAFRFNRQTGMHDQQHGLLHCSDGMPSLFAFHGASILDLLLGCP